MSFSGQDAIKLIGRFNRLAWGAPSATHPKGLIAAGMETGEVHVYDPEKIIAGKRYVTLSEWG